MILITATIRRRHVKKTALRQLLCSGDHQRKVKGLRPGLNNKRRKSWGRMKKGVRKEVRKSEL